MRAIPSAATIFLVMILWVLLGSGCGEEDREVAGTGTTFIEESGTIENSDTRDPNHNDLLFDSFFFDVHALANVGIDVEPEGFTCLIKLVESETGAVLAEWDPHYSAGDGLSYTVAASGEYEARVYSMDGETGPYTVVLRVGR